MQVVKEKIITSNEALSLLTDRQKQGNLSYEQQNTFNYLEDLIKLDDKVSQKMLAELKDAGLTEWQAVKVVDLLPKKEEELSIFVSGAELLNAEAAKKAIEISKNYRKKAKEPAKTKKVEPAPTAPEAEPASEGQAPAPVQEAEKPE